MKKKEFDPSVWVNKPTEPIKPKTINNDIEKLIQEIESRKLDITTTYENWLKVGFALADEFKEDGRDYFHRLSQFYQGYTTKETNKQFDNCLKAKKQGITLKSLFHLAKESGISLKPRSFTNENESSKFASDSSVSGVMSTETPSPLERVGVRLPTFPDFIFPQLPEFLQKVVKVADSNEERDILLLGSIVSLSACLHKVYGIYDGKKAFPNLFLFITAQASAGKGRLVHCKQLVKPIHKHLREQAKVLKQQHEFDMMMYNEVKGKDPSAIKPSKPREKLLFIPANNSTTGVFQLLDDNDGRGLMFETEGDTLAQAFKTDYGNYSDGFRKAFHHETISYYRRTDREYADIDHPSLSTVLSGTPKQVANLIPNAENGLFSRFIYYFMNIKPVWKNVFAVTSDNGLDDYFDHLGTEFFELYQNLENNQEIQFCLTPDQQNQFNIFFEQIQSSYVSLQGLDYMATIRRLGLIAFRIAMILSALRIMESGNIETKMICEDKDFQTTIELVKVLVKHASKIYSELPEETQLPKRKNQKEKFLDSLPSNFNRQDYLKIATNLTIPEKTAEGYITDFIKHNLIHREKKDQYSNPSAQETQEIKETKDESQNLN